MEVAPPLKRLALKVWSDALSSDSVCEKTELVRDRLFEAVEAVGEELVEDEAPAVGAEPPACVTPPGGGPPGGGPPGGGPPGGGPPGGGPPRD